MMKGLGGVWICWIFALILLVGAVWACENNVSIGNSGDEVELNESIGEVRDTITEIEFCPLSSGSITTKKGTTKYYQYLRLRDVMTPIDPPRILFTKEDGLTEEVADWMFVRESTSLTNAIFEYELSFDVGLKSKLENGKLTDLYGKKVKILGDDYIIVGAEVLGGIAIHLFLEGSEGSLDLTDTNYTDNIFYPAGAMLDFNTLEDSFVMLSANYDPLLNTFTITRFLYRVVANSLPGSYNIYVPEKQGIRNYLNDPDSMLGRYWDIFYDGLRKVGDSKNKLDVSGDDQYVASFENRNAQQYVWALLSNEGGIFKFGDDDNDFVFEEGIVQPQKTYFNVGIRDFFIISNQLKNNNNYDDNAVSHILRYNSLDTSTSTITFEDLSSGQFLATYQPVSNLPNVAGMGTFILDNVTYTFYVSSVAEVGNDNPLVLDMNGDELVDRKEIRFTFRGGGIVDFGNGNFSDGGVWDTSGSTPTWINTPPPILSPQTMELRTLAEDFDENAPATLQYLYQPFDEFTTFNIESKPNNTINIDRLSFKSNGAFQLNIPDDSYYDWYGMTDYGVWFNLYDSSYYLNEPASLKIEYPLKQRYADVYLRYEKNETPKEVCDDGVDNDFDGYVDCADKDCAHAKACQQKYRPEICDDGIDNDLDNQTDCYDILDCGGFCINTLQKENQELKNEIQELQELLDATNTAVSRLSQKVKELWCAVFGCEDENVQLVESKRDTQRKR